MVLGSTRSSGLSFDKSNKILLTTSLSANISPNDGLSPSIGFASLILGCFNPRYVVATSNALII